MTYSASTVDSPSGSETSSPSVDYIKSSHGASVGSPCVDVCESDSDFVCIGCRRTIEEVLKWPEYTDEQKKAVLDRLFGDN
ncbi:DUF1289 domain-containing protein [Spiribacter pallidus]|uniref:DUF1289 domain-containing protein n=1 Tax=Spiribacter pallidus TaxID=1987936 RepID=UPI00349F8395